MSCCDQNLHRNMDRLLVKASIMRCDHSQAAPNSVWLSEPIVNVRSRLERFISIAIGGCSELPLSANPEINQSQQQI